MEHIDTSLPEFELVAGDTMEVDEVETTKDFIFISAEL